MAVTLSEGSHKPVGHTRPKDSTQAIGAAAKSKSSSTNRPPQCGISGHAIRQIAAITANSAASRRLRRRAKRPGVFLGRDGKPCRTARCQPCSRSRRARFRARRADSWAATASRSARRRARSLLTLIPDARSRVSASQSRNPIRQQLRTCVCGFLGMKLGGPKRAVFYCGNERRSVVGPGDARL